MHAARLRRRNNRRRAHGVTALLSVVVLVCAAGITWKLMERIGEWRGVQTLRAALDAPAAEVVVIRRKATPLPDTAGAPPMPTPTPSDPEMQEMLQRVDNLRLLQSENGDLYGWVSIPDTRIDYPVMYAPDRKWYYLDRDFEGGRSKSGLPFIDETCAPAESRFNLLVYGHNMKDGSMFAGLHKFTDREYYEAHRTLYLITPADAARYRIVAVANVEVTEDSPCPFYLYTNIGSETDYAEYARIIKEASLYPEDMDARFGDELITLCTCGKHATPERLIVVAKREG